MAVITAQLVFVTLWDRALHLDAVVARGDGHPSTPPVGTPFPLSLRLPPEACAQAEVATLQRWADCGDAVTIEAQREGDAVKVVLLSGSKRVVLDVATSGV